jgi:hypothetical protein
MTASADEFPRPLSSREDAVLRLMVSAEDPRLAALRHQAEVTTVTGKCSCGCATVFLAVDHDRAAAAMDLCSPVTQTHNRFPSDPGRFRELILFLNGGWLSSLEIVFYDGPPPVEFPPPDEFATPQVCC